MPRNPSVGVRQLPPKLDPDVPQYVPQPQWRENAEVELEDVVANFARATRHCDNLVAVHRGHGGAARGRRDEETSINRAVVVLVVAAWQALVQDLALAALDHGAPLAGSPLSKGSYALLSGRLRKEIADFSTPNAENTRRLLLAAGYDPRPYWTWSQRGGRAKGVVIWNPHDVDVRLNEWLRVRHAIAHGHAALPHVDALQAVRGVPSPPAEPPIRLVDAEDCLRLFRRIARLSVFGMADEFGVSRPSWPWSARP